MVCKDTVKEERLYGKWLLLCTDVDIYIEKMYLDVLGWIDFEA